MKIPTWAIVIGICLMLFGGCSVSKNIQAINMPSLLEMQQNMITKMHGMDTVTSQDTLATAPGVGDAEAFKNIAEGMTEIFKVSEFAKTWTVRFGYIGLFVATLYILSGVFLLLKRSFSIQLVYIALVTSIVFSGIQSLVLASDPSGGLISKTAGFGNIFGIIVDIVLVVVIVAIDKTTYLNHSARSQGNS